MRDYGHFWINHVWLDYSQSNHLLFPQICHWFNLIEGTLWIALGGFILCRYWRHRKTTTEIWFALAFVAFGLSDYYEAWLYPTWLLWVKAANLGILLKLRGRVAPHYHSGNLPLLSF